MSESIKVEMTWESTLPLLLLVLEDGDAKGRKFALEELQRMARAADVAVGAGRKVVDSWESGDLAGAVRELDAALSDT
jgi:hypothetical protein